jgi:general secretion pathway protein D
MKKFAAVILSVASLAPQRVMPQQAQPPGQTEPPVVSAGSLNLNNASLTEVVDILCRLLRLNYMLDPAVKGSVSINTYGETRNIDARSLLDTILRINGATMIQVGELYRIVPIADAQRLPISVQSDLANLPNDDQTVLALVFLKYATVGEVVKLIEPFLGSGARVTAYQPANLMFVMDSRRSIRRALELISMFDSDTLASQRVKLYDLKHASPTEMAEDLEDVLKSISLTEKNSLVRFLPIDRLNMLIAVAPNPGAFEEVEKWIAKLDTEAKTTSSGVSNYVYRVKYSRAEILAMVISMLYGGFGYGGGMMGGFGGMGMMGGYGGMMGGGMMGGYGGMMGGAIGSVASGINPYGATLPGGVGPAYAGVPAGGAFGFVPGAGAGAALNQGGQMVAGVGVGGDQTGQFLGYPGQMPGVRVPRIIPNPVDNTLFIQSTPQEWQQIQKVLKDVDIPPRQVLIDAKVYEVSLTGAFASGVSAFLRPKDPAAPQRSPGNNLTAALQGATTALTASMLVGQSRELLAAVQLAETEQKSKVISSPSVIATDSIAASVNVGVEVPTLTSQAVSPVQSGGTSQFANTISNRSTGVNLNITARVTPAGIVTLFIQQEVSAPQAPAAGGIQSPSFSRRAVNTQVTVQDGDTIAIAGIINESDTSSSAGIPVLHRLPIVGYVFGSKSISRERTELVIFMTPRVIYDTNEVTEASDEILTRFKRLQRILKN